MSLLQLMLTGKVELSCMSCLVQCPRQPPCFSCMLAFLCPNGPFVLAFFVFFLLAPFSPIRFSRSLLLDFVDGGWQGTSSGWPVRVAYAVGRAPQSIVPRVPLMMWVRVG